jgi:hypothetical protein
MYTNGQIEFLRNCLTKKKYLSKNGHIRTRKIARAFALRFGETRAMQGIGWKLRQIAEYSDTMPRVKRAYHRRSAVKTMKHKQGITLDELETRVSSILEKIEQIKIFVK